ncbi:MAG: proline/glycine betaine ABC transporter permease [Rhodospirillaceae bacterium]|nr:proline/glycine betaine ABC transporter permease [Rhodospirillaceae bacterium]
MNFFLDFGPTVAHAVNQAIDWLVITYGDGFESFSDGMLVVLITLEHALRALPPWLVIIGVGVVAFWSSRRWTLSLGLVLATYLIGCLGVWSQAMQTVAIMSVSVGLSVMLGLPVGVAMSRSPRLRSVALPLLDLMQTIPSFVYLIPAAMLFGLGKVPAILATVIYAMPPLVRLTDLGIRLVDTEVLEAARAFGATRWQMLRGVQLPLALPNIMQGINQTLMMALAMVVIASMIGARGLGETVLLGLQRNDSGRGAIGGIAIVALAIIFDRITQSMGFRMQSHRSRTKG